MKKAAIKKAKDPRGGPGRNAGRKPKYNEATDTKAFRLPISLIKKITDAENSADRAYSALKNEFDNGIQE